MSNHPYPQHIADDVADYLKPYTSSHAESESLARQLLNRIWRKSRVDTYEELAQLPDGTVIEDEAGDIGMKMQSGKWRDMMLDDNDGVFEGSFYVPAHVLHWGDADE